MKSNVLFFLILSICFLGNIGCGDQWTENMRDKHIIPYVPVSTVIDMNMADYLCLKTSGESVLIKTSNIGKSLGYSNHGIIVINVGSDNYKCWDATCTNCTDLKSSFNTKDIKGNIAVCPTCKSEFLLLYGQLIGGGENANNHKVYPLKEYPISKVGNKLTVNY